MESFISGYTDIYKLLGLYLSPRDKLSLRLVEKSAISSIDLDEIIKELNIEKAYRKYLNTYDLDSSCDNFISYLNLKYPFINDIRVSDELNKLPFRYYMYLLISVYKKIEKAF
jgi:hypothetical protein